LGTKNVTEDVNFSLQPKLERKARKKVKKSISRMLKRQSTNLHRDKYLKLLDAYAQSYDPHTAFFPPEEKEDFDISMTGKLEGIGAVLREEDGYIKVVRIIPGSASWRQKQLQEEDIITKVAQSNKEAVDIVDMPVREAVKLIRGKKGTRVILTVKKPSNQIVEIPIMRDVVTIESTYAKSAIINTSKQDAYGYIYLPSFYRDFKDNKSRNAGTDIRHVLQKFNDQNIKGVILDLRNNGGGSLKDAVQVSGHFIRTGPIVQVKNRKNRNEVLYDFDPTVAYSGPIIVLVNNFSASAS